MWFNKVIALTNPVSGGLGSLSELIIYIYAGKRSSSHTQKTGRVKDMGSDLFYVTQ